jgi:hypothetical protein
MRRQGAAKPRPQPGRLIAPRVLTLALQQYDASWRRGPWPDAIASSDLTSDARRPTRRKRRLSPTTRRVSDPPGRGQVSGADQMGCGHADAGHRRRGRYPYGTVRASAVHAPGCEPEPVDHDGEQIRALAGRPRRTGEPHGRSSFHHRSTRHRRAGTMRRPRHFPRRNDGAQSPRAPPGRVRSAVSLDQPQQGIECVRRREDSDDRVAFADR